MKNFDFTTMIKRDLNNEFIVNKTQLFFGATIRYNHTKDIQKIITKLLECNYNIVNYIVNNNVIIIKLS